MCNHLHIFLTQFNLKNLESKICKSIPCYDETANGTWTASNCRESVLIIKKSLFQEKNKSPNVPETLQASEMHENFQRNGDILTESLTQQPNLSQG